MPSKRLTPSQVPIQRKPSRSSAIAYTWGLTSPSAIEKPRRTRFWPTAAGGRQAAPSHRASAASLPPRDWGQSVTASLDLLADTRPGAAGGAEIVAADRATHHHVADVLAAEERGRAAQGLGRLGGDGEGAEGRRHGEDGETEQAEQGRLLHLYGLLS